MVSTVPSPDEPDAEPLGDFPRMARRHARLAMQLRRSQIVLRPMLDELERMLGTALRLDEVDVIPRPSGLKRPGAIAQFSWPRLGSRLGLGIEPSLTHAIVDRLLGFDRSEPEHKLQVSPIEWGILGFVVARLLNRLAETPGPIGPWDLYLDRVGPEPFAPEDLGPIITLAWPLHVGPVAGIARLWIPEVIVALALLDDPLPPSIDHSPAELVFRFGTLNISGRIEVGTVSPPGGREGLSENLVLPISTAEGPLGGTPLAPEGPAILILGD